MLLASFKPVLLPRRFFSFQIINHNNEQRRGLEQSPNYISDVCCSVSKVLADILKTNIMRLGKCKNLISINTSNKGRLYLMKKMQGIQCHKIIPDIQEGGAYDRTMYLRSQMHTMEAIQTSKTLRRRKSQDIFNT